MKPVKKKPVKNSARVRFNFIRTAALLALVALLLAPAVARAQQAIASKRVLVLYSYNKDFPANVRFDRSFQAALQSARAGSVEYYPEYMETDRFPGEKQAQGQHVYLRQKYSDRDIDVVVAAGGPALEFLLKNRSDLFTNTPIVFVMSSYPNTEQHLAGPGLTGIVTNNTYRKTLDMALKLHPGTEQVFIISGTLERDKRIETVAREELQGYESKVGITYLTDLPPNELIAKAENMPERSIILYVWQQAQNEQGKFLESADVLALIAGPARVPIYGMSGNLVGRGIVGGYVFTTEGNATRVAEIALRIANGARAKDIPVENAPALPMFDWRQLQRWKINEDRLPQSRIIQNKVLTFWEQYRQYIIGGIVLVVVQTLLIAYLLLERDRRQRAMRGLRESEERFSKAFHSSPQPMSIASLEEGRYLDVNDRFLEISGYAREELIGHSSLDLNIWEGIGARAELVEPLKEGKSVRNLETKFRAKNGQSRFLLSSAELIELSGRPRILVASSDITERKQAEEALNQLNAELEQRVADRTAALDAKARELETFTYSVAHDLKAPLRGIEGYSRLLLEDHLDGLDDEGRAFLHTIRKSTERMNRLIDDLLAYSRIERRALRAEPIELRPFVETLVEERKMELEERKINLTMEVDGGVVFADAAGLSQALRNYLDNAIKFTSGAPEPRIEVGAEETEKSCRLWVRDNGVGFDMKHHDRIFDIFQRLHRLEDYPGTGIGLAIVRKAMERMGGRAWAESGGGRGATFYLELTKHHDQMEGYDQARYRCANAAD
ncbi:MAG TPA: ABC transporter substrate binding protein [Blastocatellia bacterium]|nr:ABC transporter substrate binding protein [Blastocatellia bacterium]